MAARKSARKKSPNKKTSKKAAKKSAKSPVKVASRRSSAPTARKSMGLAARTLIGARVPDLVLPSTGGAEVRLRDLMGKKVVLYFYPKDMTPGCTIEGHDFSRLKTQFEAANTVVFGISRDTVDSHEKFKSKECYTVDLLSDVDEKMCKAFDVIKMKNMYGKQVRGIERSTFIVDETGKIIKEWRGVSVDGHAEEVLRAVSRP